MQRMAARLPFGWQIDLEDLGNEHGKPKIQPCNACVSSSMALRVWPCNCYDRIAIINLAFFGTWIFTAVWRVQTPGHSSGQSIGTGPPRTSSCSENCTRTRKRTAWKTSRQRSRHLMSGRAASRSMWKARELWGAPTMLPAARSPRRNNSERTTHRLPGRRRQRRLREGHRV